MDMTKYETSSPPDPSSISSVLDISPVCVSYSKEYQVFDLIEIFELIWTTGISKEFHLIMVVIN